MRIGEISKILNLKPETIRYYEQEGIIYPHRKGDSAFREYNIWDFLELCECRRLRQMDFGIKDIKRLMKSESLAEVITALFEKHAEILKTVNRKIVLAAEVKSLADRIRNAPLNIGNYWFKREEEKIGIYFTKRTGTQYADVDTNNPYLQKWLANNLFINGYISVRVDDILAQRDRNDWFFCTSLINFQMLHLPEQGVIHIPEQMYLHTVLDIGEKESLTLEMMEPVLDYIKSKGLETENYIIGEIMMRCYEGKTLHRYVEIMAPIKNQQKEA